jgi:hypothetical protein
MNNIERRNPLKEKIEEINKKMDEIRLEHPDVNEKKLRILAMRELAKGI